MSDELFYYLASREFNEGYTDPALLAKATALADGDPKRVRYGYIRLRVEQLQETSEPLAESVQETLPADKPTRTSNYVVQHWRGEQSLPWSYWVNGIGLNLLASLLYAGFGVAQKQTNSGVAVILLSVIAALQLWSWVGIWRSANRYIYMQRRAISSGSSIWGYLARISVVLGVLSTVPALVDSFTLVRLELQDQMSEFTVGRLGTTDVTLHGPLNSYSVDAVIRAFEEERGRTALVINSEGGYLSEAFRLADYINERRLVVAAQGECYSACLLVLATAPLSAAHPGTRLAFHHPEDAARFYSVEVQIAGEQATDEYYRRFRQAGVPLQYLQEYRRRSWVDLSLGEAFDAQMIDYVWIPGREVMYSKAELCPYTDCYAVPVVVP